IEDQWVAFPHHAQLADAACDMVVAGRMLPDDDVAIMMVEAEATEHTWDLVQGGRTAPTEEVVAAGLEAAKPFIAALCRAQQDLAGQAGKPVAEYPAYLAFTDEVYAAVEAATRDELAQALTIGSKVEREARLDEIRNGLLEKLDEAHDPKEAAAAFRALTKELVRDRVLREQVRIDGRGLTDI